MPSLFIIREKSTNTFCTSSKNNVFSSDINSAAMFNSRKSAEKSMKKMFEVLTTAERQQYNLWYLNGVKCHPDLTLYVQQYLGWCGLTEVAIRSDVTEKICDMEVVEVKLSIM